MSAAAAAVATFPVAELVAAASAVTILVVAAFVAAGALVASSVSSAVDEVAVAACVLLY